jgi:endonuclease III
MATQSKAQLLNDIHTLLKKRYKPKPDRSAPRLTVLEAVVYGICHEDTTREQANQALSRFKDDFFDWNEVRVSTIEEVQSALAGSPDPEERAQRIRRFLRQLFERTYGFTLEALTKKPLKDAMKVLHDYEALGSDYVAATVIQQSLGGHAIPVDAPTRRALERLGIADAGADVSTLRAMLERAVPKNRGAEFVDLIEELAHDTCVPGLPECPRCDLRKMCPTARHRKEEAVVAKPHAAKTAKGKVAPPKSSKDGVKAPKRPQVKAAPAKHPAKGAAAVPKAAKGKSGGSK